jgi:hypothetical protein
VALALVVTGMIALTGCAQNDERDGVTVEPQTAAQEIVDAVAAGREAVGGEWLGGWDLNLSSCPDGGEQFAGYFEQQPARDPGTSESAVRGALEPYGAEVVRTDRPDGSVELLLARDDGFLTLVTITDAKTSFTATSACFPDGDGDDVDPAELLPRSEPDVQPL